MTIEEMKQEIDSYCGSRYSCDVCILFEDGSCTYEASDENIIESFNKLYPKPIEPVEEEPPTEVEHDVINRPNHYCRDGAMECIDEMVLIFGKEVVKHFALCNIWKYRYRSADKNGAEDIKKSDRYVQIYKELCSDE